MTSDTLIPRNHKTETKVKENDRVAETAFLITRIRNNIWAIGVPSWLFGITDRGIAAFADGNVSVIEIFQIFTASLFFLSWLFLKPEINDEQLPAYDPGSKSYGLENCFAATRDRMADLQNFHLIRQEYILPFPYLCQIYHLLNLKHLEDIHSFSLNNLRILKVSEFQSTSIGGLIRFQTVLDSSFNALRIWRQPIVEVDLILHNPYTVELSIPVYNGRRIIVLFNVFPVSETEHKLFIDIYSDLRWFKPLLQLPLHIASSLTLFEDLSYLQALAERNLNRLVKVGKVSSHETMQLFQRFIDVYRTTLDSDHASLLNGISITIPAQAKLLPESV